MRRLSVRLALAMVGTMVLSLLIIAGTQRLAEYRSYWSLPEEARNTLPPPRSWLGLSFDKVLPQRGPPPRSGPVDSGGAAYLFTDFRRFQDESFYLGVALASLVTLGLALWLSKLVATPIAVVSRAADRVAKGDLAVRVPVTPAQLRSSLETQRLSESFNTMAASLEGYEAERKAMIADIAHELRTPLTAMKLRLQALEDGLLPLDDKEILSLNRSADLLARLVEDLRTLSLADAGRLRLLPRDTDLRELVAGVLDDQRPRFDAKGVALELEGAAGSVRAKVDPDRLVQVVGNLLDNALKVTEETGVVKVSLARAESDAVIGVADSGPGLSQEALEKAFDRFFQDRDQRHGNAHGSGLGLAIVDALVRLHGGSVRAANHARGALFEVRIPVTGPPRAG